MLPRVEVHVLSPVALFSVVALSLGDSLRFACILLLLDFLALLVCFHLYALYCLFLHVIVWDFDKFTLSTTAAFR